MATKRKAPWNRTNPKKDEGKPSRHLTSAQKASAKRSARKAGRQYPNLVDNMNAAKKKSSKRATSSKRGVARKSTTTRAAKKTTAKKK